MEAPEKIYIGIVPSDLGNYKYATVGKDFPDAVEYTRTNAFIEKAVAWLKENAANFVSKDNEGEPYLYRIGLANEFIKAMML